MRKSLIVPGFAAAIALAASQAPLVAQQPAPKPAARPSSSSTSGSTSGAGTQAKPQTPAAAATPDAAAPAAVGADTVVLTVGTEKITKSQFEMIFEQVTAQMPPDRRAAAQTPDAKRQLAEQLAELKALAQEGRKEKLDLTADAKTQMMMRNDQIIAGMVYQQIAKNAKPDAASVKAYYDEHKTEYESVTARHILIRMKGSAVPLKEGQEDLSDEQALAKAKDLRTRVIAGEKFEDLAKTQSDDAGSGANGGALGDFTHGRMVPQFEEAAFALKVDEVSEPVKTQFGYHVIQVQKHETKKLEDVQSEIEQKISPDMTQKGVDAIKAKTTITFDQGYFGK